MTRIAKDIMVTKLVTLEPETPVLLGIQKLIRSNIKGAPVVDSDRNYLGIFTERCCLNVLTKLLDRRGWAHPAGPAPATCGDIMARKLWTLPPEMDAFDAVNFLLAHRISGAPVVDAERRFLGVFSESGSMRVLIGAIYDSLPGAEVRSYMDRSPERLVSEEIGIQEIANRFLTRPHRRLPVMRNRRVVGQVSRRDVLSEALALVDILARANAGTGRSWTVSAFMDSRARTIDESTDLFSIAGIFRDTDQRRLPVLQGERLVGQITRKTLLGAANSLLNRPEAKAVQPLYFASVPDASPPGA